MHDSTTFALALERMKGVGRVTAGRILDQFTTYEDLLRFPREQVLVRLKGAPRAESVVKTLFDEPAFRQRLAGAESQLQAYREKRIEVIAAGHECWPAGIANLPPSSRPNILYTYGRIEKLRSPIVSFLARPPLSTESFELAQELVRFLLRHGITSAAGTSHGFDVVVHRITAACPDMLPSIAVAGCGLARVPSNLRPVLAAGVRAGGLMVSSFPPAHGPFDHDDRERALLMAAVSSAPVFVEPRIGTHEHQALEWALQTQRRVFVMQADADAAPPGTVPITGPADFERVATACGNSA